VRKMEIASIFKTERLILRKPGLDDAEEIFRSYAQDVEVTKYLTWVPHLSLETTRSYLNQCVTDWGAKARFPYSICLKNGGPIIGMVDVRVDKYKADLGYVLAKEYWKKGYMAEALSPIVDAFLGQSQISRVWAFCDLENYGSRRVLEKIGMECEGKLRRWMIHPNLSSIPRDCFVFSKIK
jgi:[ribosomal protein S5]-alanine N-acetyltransferase